MLPEKSEPARSRIAGVVMIDIFHAVQEVLYIGHIRIFDEADTDPLFVQIGGVLISLSTFS